MFLLLLEYPFYGRFSIRLVNTTEIWIHYNMATEKITPSYAKPSLKAIFAKRKKAALYVKKRKRHSSKTGL